MGEMRRGNAATVMRGPYAGEQLSAKGSKVGQRQRAFAQKLHKAGLLSGAGLKAVLRR